MLQKLPCYVPSYLLTPPQFPPLLPGEQRCGTRCPPVTLTASAGSSSTGPTARHVKAAGDVATTPHSSTNMEYFTSLLQGGGEGSTDTQVNVPQKVKG